MSLMLSVTTLIPATTSPALCLGACKHRPIQRRVPVEDGGAMVRSYFVVGAWATVRWAGWARRRGHRAVATARSTTSAPNDRSSDSVRESLSHSDACMTLGSMPGLHAADIAAEVFAMAP